MTTKVFIPLTITEKVNTLQTFSIQRIESTDKPIEFRITNITLETEGFPTPSQEVVSVDDDESKSSESMRETSSGRIISLLSFIGIILLL